jgi:large subunit ribosomal protein L29
VRIQKAVITVKSKKYVEDLRTKSAAELNEELVAAKKELFNLRFQNATNQLDNTSRIHEVRKNIARISTLIAQSAKTAD